MKILQAFLIGETLVTQALWTKVMETTTNPRYSDFNINPSKFKGSPMLPVENVNLINCFVFCNQLSKLEGLKPCFQFETDEQYGEIVIEYIKKQLNF